MKLSAIAKFITGGYEALLAIPFLGGSIVLMSGYGALGTALILHLIALLVAFVYRTSKTPNIFGIIANLLAWIPVIGWLLHTIAAIALLVSAFNDNRKG